MTMSEFIAAMFGALSLWLLLKWPHEHQQEGLFYLDQAGNLVKRTNGEKIPIEEPVFVIRGRDKLALRTLAYYLLLAEKEGCNIYLREAVRIVEGRFMDFATNYEKRMKMPGITEGR